METMSRKARGKVYSIIALFATLVAISFQTAPANASNPSDALQLNGYCPAYVFIGARGSAEVFSAGTTDGEMGAPLGNLFRTLSMSSRFRGNIAYTGVPNYAAVPLAFNNSYLQSMLEGLVPVAFKVAAIHAQCPKSKIILAGYSQGAFIIHQFLANENARNRSVAYLAGVVLLADPAKPGTGIVSFGNSFGTGTEYGVALIETADITLLKLSCFKPLYYAYSVLCNNLQSTANLLQLIVNEGGYLSSNVKQPADPIGVPVLQYALANDMAAYGRTVIDACISQSSAIAGVKVPLVGTLKAGATCGTSVNSAIAIHTNYQHTSFDVDTTSWLLANAR